LGWITPERVPLGTVEAEIWARDWEEFRVSQEAKALDPSAEEKRKRARPLEEKDSYRWLEAYRGGCLVAEQIPETTVVVIADSEADMYEFFQEAEKMCITTRACPGGSLRSPLHPPPLGASKAGLAMNVSLTPGKPGASFAARQEQKRDQTNWP
jgi:hypothetical protein